MKDLKKHFILDYKTQKFFLQLMKNRSFFSQGIALKKDTNFPYTIIFFNETTTVLLSQIKLGSGSFGVVKLGLQVETHQLCAIKITYFSDRKALHKNNEFKINKLIYNDAKRLICKKSDCEKVYLKMPFIPGENLETLIDDNVIPLRELRKIALAYLQRLVFLHSKNIIHGDIKADNVLIHCVPKKNNKKEYKEYRVSILDYGLSHIGDRRHAALSGAPLYRSPEVYEGKSNKSRDIYASVFILAHLYKCSYALEDKINIVMNGKSDSQDIDLKLAKMKYSLDDILAGLSKIDISIAKIILNFMSSNNDALRPSAEEALKRFEKFDKNLGKSHCSFWRKLGGGCAKYKKYVQKEKTELMINNNK